MKKRLIIVANRLPVDITEKNGRIKFEKSVGGVATGLSSLYKQYESIWIGWPGGAIDKSASPAKKVLVRRGLAKKKCYPVFLSKNDIENHYEGYCNKTIWSQFHYFPTYTIHSDAYWESYRKVNEEFCRKVMKIARPGDIIWVHDYQLMLLPGMLREKMPDATIGFFLHIPFPSYEMFSMQPNRTKLLEGILGADLIGFHTYDYADNFLDSARMILGHEHSMNQLIVGSRVVKVDVFPMGIDYEKFSRSSESKAVKSEMKKLKKGIGNKKVILSIDRLDYTKGIKERLEAFDAFFDKYPEYANKVVLILVAVPSRTKVQQYSSLKKELDEILGRINGKHGNIGWVPVLYFYRSFNNNYYA